MKKQFLTVTLAMAFAAGIAGTSVAQTATGAGAESGTGASQSGGNPSNAGTTAGPSSPSTTMHEKSRTGSTGPGTPSQKQ